MRSPDDADFGSIEEGFRKEALALRRQKRVCLAGSRQDKGTSLIPPFLPFPTYTLTVSATELNSSSLSKFM
jgi:hypothetical protein